jgi:hypothetical protein
MGKEAKAYVSKNGQNQRHSAVIQYQAGNQIAVILLEEEEEDWSNSMNAYMVAEGNAVLEKYVHDDEEVDEDVKAWGTFEQEASENELGIW